jgi:regulator of cell morphogenesis and NO signaling
MTLTQGPTLADLVNANPAAITVMTRYGLDFCCGGARPLAVACSEAGIDERAVREELAALDVGEHREAPWLALAPDELADRIEATHHRYLHDALPRLEALADKVASVHGERHPELDRVAQLVRALRADLEPHLMREEQVLFPLIRAIARGAATPSEAQFVSQPIAQMDREHDTTGALLAELHDETGGYHVPPDGCTSYRALYEGLRELESDTHLHVHKETNVLFPAACALAALTSP